MGWPDWTGQPVAIIASGPSAKQADIASLKGRFRVIAIKECVDLCPWADVVYGCDSAWWRHRRGLPNFDGLKICWAGNGLPDYPDIRRVKIAADPKTTYSARLQFDPGTIGGGGNSGFQALNLAVQFGAKRILLVGFDMSDQSGVHWYGRNHWVGASNPNQTCFTRWIAAFRGAAQDLARMNIEVVNASPLSALECFPKRSIKDVIEAWS